MLEIRGTTIIAVERDGKIVVAGDGQVTAGQQVIMKNNAVKVRRIFDGKVIVGFAGTTADAFALSNHFEEMLQKYSGNLTRAAVELAGLWRNDKMLRQLEAMMIVADKAKILIITGNGDVIEPENGICAIGSGGNYALSAARALRDHTQMTAKEIAIEALKIAGEICVFTNGHITVEEA